MVAQAAYLDPVTIIFMIAVLTYISAGMLALARTQARGMHGLGWWAIAQLSLGTGLLLNLHREQLNPWLSFVLGNVMLVAGLALFICGIRLYKGEKPALNLLAFCLVSTALVSAWFGIIAPDPAVRVVFVACIYGVLAAIGARELLVPVAQPLRTAYWITGGAFAIAAVGMMTRAIFVGVIEGGEMAFRATPINMATFLAAAISQLVGTFGFVLMVNYRMAMALSQLAATDALTGALNRRSLEVQGSHIASREGGRSTGVIMLDIDHFKAINDRYGHPAGDFVLQQLTLLARTQLRENDLFARMGGEEFSIVLAEADEDLTARIAERIRAICARTPIVFNGTKIALTLSAGVTAGIGQRSVLDSLIGEADRALYQAKQAGRDKVVRWSSITSDAGLSGGVTPTGTLTNSQ